jgi:hypothetical protein
LFFRKPNVGENAAFGERGGKFGIGAQRLGRAGFWDFLSVSPRILHPQRYGCDRVTQGFIDGRAAGSAARKVGNDDAIGANTSVNDRNIGGHRNTHSIIFDADFRLRLSIWLGNLNQNERDTMLLDLIDGLSSWLNANQGVVSVLILVTTLFLGWVSGIFTSLRRKPNFALN